MIAVNALVQDAYDGIGMSGLGESSAGEYAKVGEKELNLLISELNSEGYIALSQDEYDIGPMKPRILFYVPEQGEEVPDNVIAIEPPEKVEALARKSGNRFLPIPPMDPVQMSFKNPASIPTGWTYERKFMPAPSGETREVGILRMNGVTQQGVRVWVNSRLPNYSLDEDGNNKIYLSDLYRNLLLTGLQYRLACFYELSEQKKSEKLTDYGCARSLIKRNNVTQRMIREGVVDGGYADAYYDGVSGYYWG